MEAKRIKLDNDGLDSGTCSPNSAKEASPCDISEVIPNELNSQDPRVIVQALIRLKSSLRSKAAIEEFMQNERTSEVFSLVVNLLVRSATDIGDRTKIWLAILKESISVIANCCCYSTAACLKMAAPRITFTHIAVRILESGVVQKECKNSLVRLIANMCLHKEPALCIASNSSLVDRLALMLETDASTATQALRAIRGLIACTCFKVVLLSNTGFHLGKLLINGRNTESVVQALTGLARRRVRDTGRQVAGSDCAERLLELFFDGNVRGAKELVLLLCEGSTDMRDRMGEAGAIQRIVESANDSTINCKLLAAFAQEAWGRAALRESGALDFLISRLSSTDFRSRDRLTIVQPLHHFVHDTSGMAHLARNRVFVDTVVKDVTEFVSEWGVLCKPEIISDEYQYRPNSPLLMEIESDLQKKGDYEGSYRLHIDYSSLWATNNSPSPSRSLQNSPMYSLPSSGAGSPSSVATSSTLASPYSSQSCLSDLDSADADEAKAEGIKVDVRCERTVVESELWLLTWQAQEDANLSYLIREDVVTAVLSYLSLIPSPDYRIGRILRRLASCRQFIDSLLSMQFHTRVFHALCTVPCRVVRYSKRCARCERAADFGREILRVFSAHVDSDFGDSFLIKRLSSEDFITRIVATIAKVVLIRDRFRLGRTSSGRTAVELLFESLHSLLSAKNFLEISDQTTYKGGPPVCAQIVSAISTLIAPQRLREILEIDATVRPQKRGECLVDKHMSGETSEEMLVFHMKDGEELARVPMEAICQSSLFFQGMFTSNMLEKCSGRRNFSFCPELEDCSAEDFKKFLHHLAGCRSACSAIQSPRTCAALIKLSDRYLCPTLSEAVCGPHGPARRLLTGETLPVFLPAVLTTQTHERLVEMCLLTLARYSTSSMIVSALRSICHSRLLVDSLIEHMEKLTTS